MTDRMLVSELERLYAGAIHELVEVEQLLGEALGYPRYVDDPKNFPEATEADGVCVGEMTPAALAEQAANRIKVYDGFSGIIQAQTKMIETQRELLRAIQQENSQLEKLNKKLREKKK